MKKGIFILLFFSLLFVLSGCNNDDTQKNDVNEEMNAWFMIPPNEAKAKALQFLKTNSTRTKSISDEEVEVQSVWRTLTFNNSSSGVTRSQSTYTEEVPVYIFTLTNGGYVVSVGDKRVLSQVIAFSDEEEWNISQIPGFEAVFWDNVDNFLINTLSESEVDMCDTYELLTFDEKDKFISNFLLKWGQSPSPYNDSVPACTSTTNMLAGCVAVAMGQIMAYHGKPLSGTYLHQRYGRTVKAQYDWLKIREQLNAQNLTSTAGRSGVANLLAEAGYKVNMDYGCNASGASISAAVTGFKQMGYSCSSLVSYNLSTIIKEINNKRPVYITGINSTLGGHAWIIEGYKEMITNILVGRDCPYGGGETIPPTLAETLSSYYLYFNLGWHGSSNGFYSATVFSQWPFSTNAPQIIYNIMPNS